MSEPTRCGPHSTISSNESARLTQCSCGVYHLYLLKRGVSMQLTADEMRGVAEAVGLAMRVAEAEDRCAPLAGSGTIN
jgi:hypothetical protein